MSKLIERLVKKIECDLGIQCDPQTFVSIRPKPSYKLAGAWSWEMRIALPDPVKGIVRVGSSWTATECARKNVKLFAAESCPACWKNEIDIVPENIDITQKIGRKN